jgi:hypothetical protein
MISYLISYSISCCEHDCVVVLAPFPNNQNPGEYSNVKTNFQVDLQVDCLVWYARHQLFFNCTLCSTGTKGGSHTHKEVSLGYFSIFEPIELTPDGNMQLAVVPMLYDSAYLFIGTARARLRENPSFRGYSCFIGGNSHPTIPHC